MKIRIKNNGVKATVEMSNYVSDSATTKIAELVSQLVTNIHKIRRENAVSTAKECAIEQSKSEEEKTTSVVPTERPAIRSRIPNNIVNIEDLSLTQAVTENALVRCPHCGQAHAIIVNDNTGIYLMRKDYQKNEFVVIAEYGIDDNTFTDACCKDDTDKQIYFKDLQKQPELSDITQFNVTNETELFCPVCRNSNDFKQWKDAYENPLKFFETDQLCDACGGEKLPKVIKNKTVYCCDKCGLITDYEE